MGERGRHGLVADQAPQSLGTVHRPRVPWKILAPICSPPFGSSPRRFRTEPIPPPSRAGTSPGGDHLVLESSKDPHVRPPSRSDPSKRPAGLGGLDESRLRSAQPTPNLSVLGPPFDFVPGPGPVECRSSTIVGWQRLRWLLAGRVVPLLIDRQYSPLDCRLARRRTEPGPHGSHPLDSSPSGSALDRWPGSSYSRGRRGR